eukprot:553656_1
MALTGDQIGLWLTNRSILSNMKDSVLLSNLDRFILCLEGIKHIFELCLKNPYNLTIQKHEQLFKLFKQIQEEEKLKLKQHQIQSLTQITMNINTETISLINIHDVALHNIFKFLDKITHCKLRECNRHLFIIGRNKNSFNINQTGKYNCFGEQFKLIHKLQYIRDNITLQNDQNNTALSLLMSFWNKPNYIEQIIFSGILTDVFSICKSNDENSLILLNTINSSVSNVSVNILNSLIKHGLFIFIVNDIYTYN